MVENLDVSVTVTCKTKGVPTPHHRWYKNGNAVVNNINNKFITYDGTLIITKVLYYSI